MTVAEKIESLTRSLETNPHVNYQWGAKANPRSLQAPDISALDCSGFTAWAMWHLGAELAYGAFQDVPDGSVNQHGYAENRFTPFTDYWADTVYWFFLAPSNGRPGHTGFLYNDYTFECCLSLGVTSREWQSLSWAGETALYEIGR